MPVPLLRCNNTHIEARATSQVEDAAHAFPYKLHKPCSLPTGVPTAAWPDVQDAGYSPDRCTHQPMPQQDQPHHEKERTQKAGAGACEVVTGLENRRVRPTCRIGGTKAYNFYGFLSQRSR